MKKVLLIIIILTSFNGFIVGQNDSNKIKYDNFVEIGDSCLFIKNYDCAIFNYEQARKLQPDNEEIKNIFNAIIKTAFNKVDYYKDSTIRAAYNLKNNILYGYAIEFDTKGNPTSIGKYKKGNKNGKWYLNNGGFTTFKNGKEGLTALHTCGTGKHESEIFFRKLYVELLFKK